MPIDIRSVDTPGLRVQYRHAGTPGRPKVVLLHGFPQTSYMWRHQLEALSDDYELFAPDTRGYGGTDKPRIRVTRDLLARDVVDFMDALDIDDAILVAHDWGGLIAFKAVVDFPERFSRLAMVDTLCSVWVPFAIHGYWFKCEPQAEEFFERYHEEFIRSVFSEFDAGYGGPPESPWRAPEAVNDPGGAHDDEDRTRHWTPEDVEHYVEAFADPGAWHHAVEYYRHALPFHREEDDPTSVTGKKHTFLTSQQVAAMWNHEGLLWSHPDFGFFPVFAPEDRHKTFDKPTLLLHSGFLLGESYADGLPPDDRIPSGNPYADSFVEHFPDYRARAADCGHFVPEEAPERTNEVLAAFLSGQI